MVWKLGQENNRNRREVILIEKEKNEYAELGKGLAGYAQKVQEKKNQIKDKIMTFLEKQDKISNHDVVKLLEISSATAVRYLDELEEEGRIKQIGKTGCGYFIRNSLKANASNQPEVFIFCTNLT